MDIIEEIQGDLSILKLSGRLDSTTSSILEEKVIEIFNQGTTRIVLDLKRIGYVSSAGLRVFKRIKAAQGPNDRILLRSVADYIQEVIELSGVDIYLPVVPPGEDSSNIP